MEWVEVSARTVAEAKESALGQLGIAEGDAEIVVVSEARTGLFGRLREEARVRARVRPVSPRPKKNRRSRSRRGESNGTGREGGPRAGTTAANGSPAKGGQATEPGARKEATPGPSGESGAGAASGARRRSRSRSRRPAANGPRREDAKGSDQERGQETAPREGTEVAHEIPLEEQGQAASEFLQGLLGSYGFEGSVTTEVVDEDTVEVAAHGDDLGLLIGPRGATLAAVQEVTRTAVQRRFPAKTDRILVDVAGYRQRRVEALQRFTRQVAEEAVSSGEERVLEPMSPADRKVVHDTVNEIEGVATRSEGEEPSRYVVITPAS